MISKQPPVYLLDGGLGTTLADNYGCVFDDSTPLWSSQLLLTSPSTLLEAHSAFARAGAEIILSATYQASLEGFARSGAEAGEAERAMREAVCIARRAAVTGDDDEEGEAGIAGVGKRRKRKGKGKVALSLGAYGATMLPSQEYGGAYDAQHQTQTQLMEWHLRRLEVFIKEPSCWAEVDFVAFETLPLLQEICAAREVMGHVESEKEKEKEREFWISCVFPGEGNALPDGSSVREVVKAMLAEKAGQRRPMGVGMNCTKVEKIESLVEEFESAVKELLESGELDEWPSLVVYPDGTKGEVYNTSTKEWVKVRDESSTSMAWDELLAGIIDRAKERSNWKSIFVGGCCKATPIDIACLSKRIG